MKKQTKIISVSASLFTLGSILFAFTNIGTVPDRTCSSDKLSEVRAAAVQGKKEVTIDCNLKLLSTDVITKRLILKGAESSGITVDCGGAKLVPNEFAPENLDRILVTSRKLTDASGKPVWIRPSDITIKNCHIEGSMRIMGMGSNGEEPDVKDSSRLDGNHTARARTNAPTRITLDKMKIFGIGRIPLYLSPGVTYVTLKNSEIGGEGSSTAIYMDAESGFNTLMKNKITTSTSRRELIALDGSSDNKIFGNYFASLNHGGIYLYRNCGEGGTIRHNSPQRNQIINNFFYYNQYEGSNKAVDIASRDGSFRIYCHLDNGYPWGSSADNHDFATQNIVVDNEFVKRGVSEMIEQNDTPNIIARNAEVAERSKKPSLCYMGSQDLFLKHAESKITKTKGVCKKTTCVDGLMNEEIVTCPVVSCPPQIPAKGTCSYDVGKYKDGQRGGVIGYFKYDEFCNFSTRVKASYNNADSGYFLEKTAKVIGDREYVYEASVDDQGFKVLSSAGQLVCEIKF